MAPVAKLTHFETKAHTAEGGIIVLALEATSDSGEAPFPRFVCYLTPDQAESLAEKIRASADIVRQTGGDLTPN